MIINSMRLFLFLLCGLFGLGLNAQTNSNSSTIVANKFDFSFIDFLISNAEFEDALLLLRNASNQIAGIDEALNEYDVVWAAAGHPHAVYPTSFGELLNCTGATPMVVGE